jgi:DNA repair exonuclease SbcCD ATPase subunit
VEVQNESDITLKCHQCGKDFVFSVSEQEFFKQKGFVAPQHCKVCRTNRKSLSPQLCSTCGLEIPRGQAVYCSVCLSGVQLEYELNAKNLQRQLDESKAALISLENNRAQETASFKSRITSLENENSGLVKEAESRLAAAASEHAKLLNEAESRTKYLESEINRLIEVVKQKETEISGLEQRLKDTECELDKSLKHRAALERLEPALTNMKDRLNTIEQSQKSIENNLFQLMRISKNGHNNKNLAETIRHLFHPDHSSPGVKE